MNDLYDHIVGLRAVRSFTSAPLAEDDVAAILEAARWTGSSKNTQRWAFIVVRDAEQTSRLAGCGDFTDPIRNASCSIALVQEAEGNEFDIGRLAQNIMLAAAALGLGACPVTLHRDAQAHEVLGLGERQRCRHAIALGYPSPDARQAKFGGRKPAADLVHWERYGSHRS